MVEAVVHFASSDLDNYILGFPIPGSMATSSVSLYHQNSERGRARIHLNFWTNGGKLLAQSPAASGETHYTDVTLLTFVGPFTLTDLTDVKTYERFMEKGVDEEWESIRRTSTQTDGTTSNVWITPEH